MLCSLFNLFPINHLSLSLLYHTLIFYLVSLKSSHPSLPSAHSNFHYPVHITTGLSATPLFSFSQPEELSEPCASSLYFLCPLSPPHQYSLLSSEGVTQKHEYSQQFTYWCRLAVCSRLQMMPPVANHTVNPKRRGAMQMI